MVYKHLYKYTLWKNISSITVIIDILVFCTYPKYIIFIRQLDNVEYILLWINYKNGYSVLVYLLFVLCFKKWLK